MKAAITEIMPPAERRGLAEIVAIAPDANGRWPERFAVTFRRKGVVAYWGATWDGACDHVDPTFWYFHPRENGGVGAYVTYDCGTYDVGFVEPATLADVLLHVEALPEAPTRAQLWAALERVEAAKLDADAKARYAEDVALAQEAVCKAEADLAEAQAWLQRATEAAAKANGGVGAHVTMEGA